MEDKGRMKKIILGYRDGAGCVDGLDNIALNHDGTMGFGIGMADRFENNNIEFADEMGVEG